MGKPVADSLTRRRPRHGWTAAATVYITGIIRLISFRIRNVGRAEARHGGGARGGMRACMGPNLTLARSGCAYTRLQARPRPPALSGGNMNKRHPPARPAGIFGRSIVEMRSHGCHYDAALERLGSKFESGIINVSRGIWMCLAESRQSSGSCSTLALTQGQTRVGNYFAVSVCPTTSGFPFMHMERFSATAVKSPTHARDVLF